MKPNIHRHSSMYAKRRKIICQMKEYAN